MLTPQELRQIKFAIDQAVDKAITKALSTKDERLTVKQVADIEHVTVSAIHERCRLGKIPFHKEGKGRTCKVYFSKKEIDDYYLAREG
jgi:hypothetical protein